MSASFFNLTLGKIQQFHKVITNGGLDGEMVETLIKYPHLAEVMVQAVQDGLQEHLFGRFRENLHCLETQLIFLKTLNDELRVSERVPAEWFEGLDVSSDHIQQVYDLEVFFVVRETPQETWDYYRALFGRAFPDLDDYSELESVYLAEEAREYEPGIHRIRLNLVDFWKPGRGQSARNARYWIKETNQETPTGKWLAGTEVLAAYLGHPELLSMQGPGDFPGAVLAGLHATTKKDLYDTLVVCGTALKKTTMCCLMENQRYEYLTTPTVLSES